MNSDSLIRRMLEHPFLRNLLPSQVSALWSCASTRELAEGELAFREGTEATEVILVRTGRIALDAHGPLTEAFPHELGPGDAFGWAWIVRGYHWPADGRVIEPTSAIVLDAACVRRKCQSDAGLGFQLARRFLASGEAYLSAGTGPLSAPGPATVRPDGRVLPFSGKAKPIASIPGLRRLAS